MQNPRPNYHYGNIISPSILHGCAAWSLTLRDEHMLKLFDSRVLRKFGQRRKNKHEAENVAE